MCEVVSVAVLDQPLPAYAIGQVRVLFQVHGDATCLLISDTDLLGDVTVTGGEFQSDCHDSRPKLLESASIRRTSAPKSWLRRGCRVAEILP